MFYQTLRKIFFVKTCDEQLNSSIVANLYFRFVTQQAKIFVSTLKCDPYDDSVPLDDLDSKIAINTGNITKIAAGVTTNAANIAKLGKLFKDESFNTNQITLVCISEYLGALYKLCRLGRGG